MQSMQKPMVYIRLDIWSETLVLIHRMHASHEPYTSHEPQTRLETVDETHICNSFCYVYT
jgi:hypothetical protein